MMRKWRKRTARVDPATNISWSPPESPLPPEDADRLTGVKEVQGLFTARGSSGLTFNRSASWSLLPAKDADQLATGQLRPRSLPGTIKGDALTASSSNSGHDGPEEELKIPQMGQARRHAWESKDMISILCDNQAPSNLKDQVTHPLVQELIRSTVAELKEQLRWENRWSTWYSWSCLPLNPTQELPETPVLQLKLASPAEAPAEPEGVPAVASAPALGPELQPHEPSGPGPMAPAGMAPGLAEPEPGPEPTSPCAVGTWDIPGVVSAPVPGPELEAHEPLGQGPAAPAGMTPGLAEPEVGLEPTSPCAASTWDVPREKEPIILAFPPRLVAEQLTLMCALQTGGTEIRAPTIHNIIRQLDATANVVTSSCLGAPSMTARDRARVVEFWIRVAKECLDLKNFMSLYAILLALKSPAIGRLQSTWGHVSWKSSWMYKKIKKMDKGLNRKQLLKVIPVLCDNMIYRHMAALDDLESKERFLSFFQAVEPLDEQESYTLSCQLEPPGPRAGRKGLFQFFRSHKI